jgi:hypothetical protein
MFLLLLSLTVSGPYAREIRDAYDRLPAPAPAITVEYVSGKSLKGNWGYYAGSGRVLLRKGLTKDATVATFYHEAGHVLFAESLTPAEQSAWQRWWKANRHRMPTANGRKNEREGIADSVMHLWSGWKLDSVVKAKVSALLRHPRLPSAGGSAPTPAPASPVPPLAP